LYDEALGARWGGGEKAKRSGAENRETAKFGTPKPKFIHHHLHICSDAPRRQ